MAFTVAAIKAATAGEVLRDAVVPGLQLRAFPTGKSFYFYYRTRGGTQRKPKVGDWPTLTIDQARIIAKDWLSEAHQGGDPSRFRQDTIKSPTMEDLRDWYVEHHAPKLKKGEPNIGIYKNHIAPFFKKMKVLDVLKTDIEDFMDHMRKKGVPQSGNAALMILSRSFKLAIARKWRTDNPATGVKKNAEIHRERYLTEDESERLGRAFERMSNIAPHSVAALRVIAMVGCRKSEIITAKREWLDGNVLRLPDSKTGKREIILPDQAVAIIKNIDARNGWLMGIKATPWGIWRKIVKMAELKDFRIHDLRHSFASEGLAAGYSLDQIGELLGHKVAQTTKRYAHLQTALRKEAANSIADRLSAKMSPSISRAA
jgi:integrase